MNRILAFIAFLASTIGAYAANPAFTDFYGTNGLVIRTNGNKVQVDGTLLNLWTNDLSLPAIRLVNQTNRVFIGTNSEWTFDGSTLQVGKQSEFDEPLVRFRLHWTTASVDDFDDYPVTLKSEFTGTKTNSRNSAAVLGVNDTSGSNRFWFYGGGAVGVSGNSGESTTGSTNSASIGVLGYAQGIAGRMAGVMGVSDISGSGYVNGIGVVGVGEGEGIAGNNVIGGLFLLDAAGAFSEATNLTSAAMMTETFASTLPHYVASKGNTGMVYRLNHNGSTLQSGVASNLAGFASFSTIATNAVGDTGYTNNQAVNQVVHVLGTAVTVTQKNRAGVINVPAITFTGQITIHLQPGEAFTAASGLTGTAKAF